MRTIFMPNYSKNEIVLIAFPLTSKTNNLLKGEFVLQEWKTAGLNVETAVKRGVFTIKENLIKKKVGLLDKTDSTELENSLRLWFGF